jgi:hypothetical protein
MCSAPLRVFFPIRGVESRELESSNALKLVSGVCIDEDDVRGMPVDEGGGGACKWLVK